MQKENCVKRKKFIYYILVYAVTFWAAGSICGRGMSDIKAAQEIYVAGMPDSWPLEYYDKKDGTYRGVIPDLIKAAGEDAGLTVRYIKASKEDLRLKLAENMQVDAVCTEGFTEEELNRAGLVKGPCLISFDSQKRQDICLAYTKSMPEEYKEMLEDAFASEDAADVKELMLKYTGEKKEEDREERIVKIMLPIVLLAAVSAFIAFPLLLRRRKKQIEGLAYMDDITGEDNFAAWKRKYNRCISDGNRNHYAVVYLFPGIEAVSHIYGYEEANEALKITSDTIAPYVSAEYEGAARFNEFYFVFFLQYTGVEQLKERIRKMEEAVDEAFAREKKKYFLELHAGIYRLTGIDADVYKALQYSEIAMEYAKNHYEELAIYNEFVEKETILGYAIEHEAIHGLMQNEFIMYIQPFIDMETKQVCGGEALVRWENPSRGLLKPDEFLNVMKKKKLMGKMNMDIYRQGCRFLGSEKEKGHIFRLLFNFTAENIGDQQFPDQIYAIAKQNNISPGQIIVQLNQMVEMTHQGLYVRTIRKIREYGFDVCLAGLELDRVFFDYLDCGINLIKLRHELVKQAGKPEGKKVIKNVAALCHDLGLKIIGVGVENKEQARILKKQGCEIASGFYYYYPVTQEVFTSLV